MTNINDVRAAIGAPPKHPALEVFCTHCRAAKGLPCTTRNLPRKDPHPCRIDLAGAAEQPTATVLPFQPRST